MSKLVSYKTIVAAKNGDSEAMNVVLRHFDRYISYCSRQTYIDDTGNKHTYVDEEIKTRIQSKLMMKIITHFDVDSLPPGETLED